MTLSIAGVADAESGEAAHVEVVTDRRRYRWFRNAPEGDWIQNVILGGARPDVAVHTAEHAKLSRERLFLLERLRIPVVGADSEAELFRRLDAMHDPERDLTSPLVLPVETTLVVRHRGLVVSGRIERGSLHCDDPVEVVGDCADTVVTAGKTGPIPASISQIELERKSVPEAFAGSHVFVLLRGIEADQVARGDVIAGVGSVTASRSLCGRIALLPDSNIETRQPYSFGIHNVRVMGRVTERTDDFLSVELVQTVPLPAGSPFVMWKGPRAVAIGEIQP